MDKVFKLVRELSNVDQPQTAGGNQRENALVILR